MVTTDFTQEYEIDYEEIFAHVAHITSIYGLLVVDVIRCQKLFQIDVKNVFLNEDLTEEMYK